MIRRLVTGVAAVLALALGGLVVPFATIPPAEAAGPSPLVLIVDTSGSMGDSVPRTRQEGETEAEAQSDYVVKLEAAKTAILPSIRNAPAGVALGIWTYGGSCRGGQWLVDPAAPTTPADAAARVEALSANGGTPTAEAIQGVVDSLQTQGIYAADLVLVSDGHSNCGDPCAVAKEVGESGFDITIQTVGFDIDEGGAAELDCISTATNGQYVDVDDAEGLENVLRDLTTPELALKVLGDPTPRAGAETWIHATVTNPSAYTAHDVRVNLSFRDAGPRTLSPAFVPATIRIGTLPPGASARRSWSFVAGTASRETDAAYTVTAWAISTGSYRAEGEFTTTAEADTASDVGDLLSELDHDRSLVILGDSYSSGEGAYDYLPGTADAAAACHRSSDTYLAPIYDAADVRVEILACSGALTGAMRAEQWDQSGRRAAAQFTQLNGLASTPGAVVTTIGGNDIGFEKIVRACVDPRIRIECGKDEDARSSLMRSIGEHSDQMTTWYRWAWHGVNDSADLQARGGDYAPVIVLGYPQAAHDDRLGACPSVNMTAFEVRYTNEVARALNSTAQRAVADARSMGYEVYFVDRTIRALQPDHSVCAADPWLNGIDLAIGFAPKPESFHPDVDGYQSVTAAIVGWSRTIERVGPDPARVAAAGRPGPDPGPASSLDDWWVTRDIARIDVETATSAQFSPRQRVEVTASGFAPGTPVLARIASQSTGLGALTADEEGRVRGVLALPAETPVGAHHLLLSGVDEGGAFRELSVPVSVVPPFPVWLVAALAGSLLLLVVAGVLLLRLRPRRGRAEGA